MTSPPPPPRAGHYAMDITTIECRDCGARVDGLNGRYACGLCGWVNPWYEGTTPLPPPVDEDDL
ncbi:hypothetical protein [Streptomyces sp. NPDC058045]|uniref:hypothetical protein n=1 Tax=Streptomyces sp. NPDC058045 TaxID=3346311 RepID=UPI0036EABCC3